ncbi:MAG: glycosyltransferase family 4 protein [Verrucomicrobia bacterium]|nr:glycosyltransferase family 4 protein [Verrucomicrobiota bacterium]
MSHSGPTPSAPPTKEQLVAILASSVNTEECLSCAYHAEQIGETELQLHCLEKAVALDRNNRPALLALAALSLDQDQSAATYAFLEEAARIEPLTTDIESLKERLFSEIRHNPELGGYLHAIGRATPSAPSKTLRIVLLTNLFPPQELGGYGRMMWEFAQGLHARGHTVRVLTSDAVDLAKKPTADESAFESHVQRNLQLAGGWRDGRAELLSDRSEIARRLRDNATKLRAAIVKQKADLVLVGNLDLLGVSVLSPAFDQRVPVLHALANANPGYAPEEQPADPRYWVAPCSDWNGEVYQKAGYKPARVETLYPGGRVDRFFRLFLPDRARLRICYASLVMPYKGIQTLVDALAALHRLGVDFTAEIAGDTPDPAFRTQLDNLVQTEGMSDKVQFTGFLDRQGLTALFARNNVLVFPSIFQEPFGISQVEALAAGLVVISSGTGGAKEIIRDGTDGLLFPAGDATTLASRLKLLLDDSSLMAKLQKNGQARASLFSVDQAVQKIELLAAELQASAAEADFTAKAPL